MQSLMDEGHNFSGVMLYGTESMTYTQRIFSLKEVYDSVPEGKIAKLYQTYGNPFDILAGALAGVNLFETEYPLVLALDKKAFLFDEEAFEAQQTEESKQEN